MGRDKKKKRKYESTSGSETDSSESETDSSKSDVSSGTPPTERRRSRDDKHKSKHSKEKRGSKSKSRKHSLSEKKRKSKKKNPDHEMISKDDYFKRSSEFRTWLSNERGIYFSDLSSDRSRKLFEKFVRKWNSGQLKKKYYEGIQSTSLEHSSQTSYKWKISGQDDIETGLVRDRVSSWTSGKNTGLEEKEEPSHSRVPAVIGPARPPAHFLDAHLKEEEREEQKKQLKHSRRDFRKHQEMVMDELLPKATGHEARIEKKRMMNQKRRGRETSPDIEDSSLMGSGSQIKDWIKSKHDKRERRAQIATQKISDYNEREKSRVAAILEMARANKKEGSLW